MSFARRHIGTDTEARAQMLETLACDSIDDLLGQVIPEAILAKHGLAIEAGISEPRALSTLRELGSRNRPQRSYIGEGYYNTYTPPVILRNVIENPSWYTAYTPYQPEVAQGRLEALMHFQSLVAGLTGLEIANASLLDEATACAEALALCLRANSASPAKVFVDEKCLPQSISVVRTRMLAAGIDITLGPRSRANQGDCAAILLRYPDVDGLVYDFTDLAATAHQRGALVAVATDLLALSLIAEPGMLGADVAVGSAQRFGVPMSCGGPGAAFLATHSKWVNLLPGRLVSATQDQGGRLAHHLALPEREQHIGREQATSNICSAQALTAVLSAFYAIWHGPSGLRQIAARTHRHARLLAAALERTGWSLMHRSYFDTLVATSPTGADGCAAVLARAQELGINLRQAGDGLLGISFDETSSPEDVRDVLTAFTGNEATSASLLGEAQAKLPQALAPELSRASPFLKHPDFHRHHSETEMMRYVRRLADRDIGLDTGMIPLGTSTMKLNSSAAMEAISWPVFTNIHPHSPPEQRAGYREIAEQMKALLCTLTGFDAVSLQPNAGSQGELAGILAVKAYHDDNGQGHRDICLIPRSAHGTNPASAAMCGLRIETVACDSRGNIDMACLRTLIKTHSERLALMMITYPSTHGVFEENLEELCRLVHQAGGQIYFDGANFNAMVGLCYPADFGCDVAQLNLHKTFAIPHGGGGPGIGPVCARKHLAPYLPASPIDSAGNKAGAVSASDLGNAGLLPVSWAYIKMMGAEGLRQASECAILGANYIAERLRHHYPLLYCNSQGRVAHECILDIRPFEQSAGIKANDLAKRLIDYSFHPPRVSFPVEGTLMIEPTESESKREIDCFIEAMISIRAEIAEIEKGAADRNNNVISNAPHCLNDLLSSTWPHPYSRETAAYPLPGLRQRKHWPPVSRVGQTAR